MSISYVHEAGKIRWIAYIFLATANTLRFEWHFDVAVCGCFLES